MGKERWWNIGWEGESLVPTAGSLGMIFALMFCNSVDTYEMVASDSATWSGYHYYGKWAEGSLKANDNTYHTTFEAEKELWSLVSTTPREVIQETGKASIPGFSSI